MKRDEAIGRLRRHEADLKRLGVAHLYIFGSTARGEARDDSDVDLFFDYEKGKFGLFELMDVKEYATNILCRNADIRPATACIRHCEGKLKLGPSACSSDRALTHSPPDGHIRSDRTHS